MALIPAPLVAEDPDDDDTSTTYTAAATPPESVATGLHDDAAAARFPATAQARSCCWPTPRPGRTCLIRSVASGQVLTLRRGKIILSQPDGRASHWECAEADAGGGGWLTFRNGVSGTYLGRDDRLRVCCSAAWRKAWEQFRVRERPEGVGRGSVLLMEHWWSLRHVGVRVENGVEILAVIENWEADEMVWEFVEVLE